MGWWVEMAFRAAVSIVQSYLAHGFLAWAVVIEFFPFGMGHPLDHALVIARGSLLSFDLPVCKAYGCLLGLHSLGCYVLAIHFGDRALAVVWQPRLQK